MKAIPFAGIEGWLNSKPLEISMLKGKVVLLDFWTYSCVNCIRTLPHLSQLWERYKDQGFVLIGIHTPEFVFEKSKENVDRAVRKHKISYPVALDSENVTWKLYGNRYWPKQVLISAEGEIVYGHIGEGGYEEIEANVVEQLQKINASVKLKRETHFGSMFHFSHKPGYLSPETYLGSLRGTIASGIVCQLDGGCHTYKDSGDHILDFVYLDGDWVQEPQFAVHQGEKGYAAMKFSAKTLHVVLDSEKNIECTVTLDGKPLNKYNAGPDIILEKNQIENGKVTGPGKSKILVDRADMYTLYQGEKIEEHEIKIETNGGLKVFAFTFG